MIESAFWQNRSVLVTGAKGFVAAHLIKRLSEAGACVVGLERDITRTGYFDAEGLSEGITLVQGDLTAHALVERLLARYEVQTVIHLAAQALVGAANEAPLTTFESNIRGTYLLLEAARCAWNEGGGTVKGVVVASSDKAYGQHAQLPYTEDTPLAALHPYDASKACADILARTYAHTYGLPVAVTRCANLYGPGDLNFSRLVPHTIRAVLEGRRPQIRSDGSPQRDYLFIDDAVNGYLTLAQQLDKPEVAGEAFNFGTGEPVSVLELVEEIIQIAGVQGIEAEVLGQSWGEIQHQYLDATRASAILDWRPQVSRSEALKITIDWYRDHLSEELAADASTD